MPSWLIPLIAAVAPSLLGMLFGGGNKDNTQTSTQTTIAPPRGIQDPTLGLLMPYMSSMLTKGMGIYGNAGMPGGQSFNTPFGGDIMSILMQNWPQLMAAYQKPKVSTPAFNPKRIASA